MRKFDYTFLKKDLLPSYLITLTSNISSLKTMAQIRQKDYKKVFSELVSIAKIQSVKNSNEIEGIVTSKERLEQIVNKNVEPINHNESEIAGYRDALNEIHQGYEFITFSESHILRLHEIILEITDTEQAGKYKRDDNLIMEIDKSGKRKIRFEPISAKETKEAMEQLELAYLDAKNDSQINQLLLIPCVILDFLCIHPFQDGNGRISRLLSLLLLYKNDYDIAKYISFEEQINKHKDDYYYSLKESSKGWHTNENSYIPFIGQFLSTLFNCYKELDKRFSKVNGKKISKKVRIEKTVLNSLMPISKSEIHEILPDVSITTIEATLGRLVKKGIIRKVGKGPATKYLNNNV